VLPTKLNGSNRRFQFHESRQLFIRANNETLSIAPMGVSNEDCSPVAIHNCDTAPAPTGFARICRSAEGNLTASSVIAVMPACTLTMPNPGSRNEWPPHCDVGIHCVWPCKLGAELALVIVFAIAAQIPHKQNKAAKQYPRFLFENFAKFTALIPRKQNKAAKQHY
jgi:hypothetical protein